MTGGMKFDNGKLRWSLVPWGPLTEIVKVLTNGAERYAPDNWKIVADARERYLNAAFRHLAAYAQGEKIDPDWGFSHLAHAGCNLLFLLWFDQQDAATTVEQPKVGTDEIPF